MYIILGSLSIVRPAASYLYYLTRIFILDFLVVGAEEGLKAEAKEIGALIVRFLPLSHLIY